MAVGEATIHDVTYDNVALVNFQPGQVVVQDLAGSINGLTAVTLPAGALAVPFGVCVDRAKLDPTIPTPATVVAGQGVAVRHWGIAFCIAAGAIAVGDAVSVADNQGRVQTQARAIAGAQPQPIVGRAVTPAAALGATVMVKLQDGATF